MASKQYRGQPWTIRLTDDDSLLPVPINIWLFISTKEGGTGVNLATITLSCVRVSPLRGRRVCVSVIRCHHVISYVTECHCLTCHHLITIVSMAASVHSLNEVTNKLWIKRVVIKTWLLLTVLSFNMFMVRVREVRDRNTFTFHFNYPGLQCGTEGTERGWLQQKLVHSSPGQSHISIESFKSQLWAAVNIPLAP